jgi:regulatory protein
VVSDGRGRRRLRLSDGREFTYRAEACERTGTRQGAVADDELFAALDAADEPTEAHEIALGFLRYRARSEAEMRRRLAMGGIQAGAIDDEIERLQRAGLLDDVRFAGAWVEERSMGRGRRRLRSELAARGVKATVATAATEDLDDAETALRLARSRSRGPVLASYDVFLSRVGGFLRRRGFDHETTMAALRLAWIEATGDPESADGAPSSDG